jgi:hypothetical protein
VAETCSPFDKPLLTPYYRKESCDLTVINKAFIIGVLLDNALQIVNFIQALPVNSRQLKLFCNDGGNHYEILNFHTEICWLSRGEVLVAVFRLRIKLHFCVCARKRNTISQVSFRKKRRVTSKHFILSKRCCPRQNNLTRRFPNCAPRRPVALLDISIYCFFRCSLVASAGEPR